MIRLFPTERPEPPDPAALFPGLNPRQEARVLHGLHPSGQALRDGSTRCGTCAFRVNMSNTGASRWNCAIAQSGGIQIRARWPGCDRWRPASA